jgi:FtsX extracellular domain
VYLKDGTPGADVDAMGDALAADPRVTSARYLDADDVLDAMHARAGQELGQIDPAIPSAYVVDLAGGADETAVRADVSDLPGVFGIADIRCEPTDSVDPPPFGQPPTLVALVREDGWLVTIDLATGQQRELHFVGDPNASSDGEEGGPYFIDSLDLSPDGQWVYFSTCCEPADGVTYRIPAAGGEPEEVGFGAYPRLSPDGRYLVTAGSAYLNILSTDDLGPQATPASVEVGCCAKRMAWSPDGSQVAVIHGTGAPDEPSQVLLFDWDGVTLSSGGAEPAHPGSFVSWTPDGTLNISSGGPVDDDRGLSQDASYRWLLWVDEEGVVRQQAGHESGDRTILTDLPEALAADW